MLKKIPVLAVLALLAVAVFVLPAGADKGGQPNANSQGNAQGGNGQGQANGHQNAPGQNDGGGAQGGGGSAGGGTKGHSDSNPDGGGVDKPYPADGQPAGSQGAPYHDGNNGCGQDKKSGEPRETGTEHTGWDDNNGWCGKPPSNEPAPNVGGTSTTNTNTTTLTQVNSAPSLISSPVSVLGIRIERPQVAPSGVVREAGGVEVLGVRFVRGEPLPLTGAPIFALFLVAATLIGIGLVARQRASVIS